MENLVILYNPLIWFSRVQITNIKDINHVSSRSITANKIIKT